MSSELMKPNLLEWKAIAYSELNRPGFARATFQAALVLDPLNERIRRNVKVFESRLESKPENFEIQAVVNAEQALQAQFQRAVA